MENYDDIINMPRHVSKKHIPMKMENRAAQFSPFAALTGYSSAIEETARITDAEKVIDENQKVMLDYKLSIIKNTNNKQIISITYFVKDNKKIGGKYITLTGNVQKIDLYKRIMTINNINIEFKNIVDITL